MGDAEEIQADIGGGFWVRCNWQDEPEAVFDAHLQQMSELYDPIPHAIRRAKRD